MANWEEVAETLRLDEVLTALGVDVGHIRNGNHWGNCPMHDDRGQHFSINEDELVGNCFHCGGFTLTTLVIRVLELEGDQFQTAFQKAVEWLLPFSDGEVADGDDAAFLEQLDKILARADVKEKRQRREPLPLYSERLLDKLKPVPQEWMDRWGIEDADTLSEFRIGYHPEWTWVRRNTIATYTGPCIVIPHFFRNQFVGYQERWLAEDRPRWLAKYTNSDDFPKKETLYNFDRAIKTGDRTILVESAMSVVRLWELGYSALCTFGSSVGWEQYRLLRCFEQGVYLAFDNDEMGRKIQRQVGRQLSEVPVYSVPFPTIAKANIADLPEPEVEEMLKKARLLFAA